MADFSSEEWPKPQTDAAYLVAEGDLTYPQIAERVGTTRQTLLAWRQRPEFIRRVEAIRQEYRAAVRERGIAILEKRVEAQNNRWRKLQRIIDERGNDETHANVPGWTTGLLVHDVKMIGSGPAAMAVDLFAVDAALLKEMRELEKQTAMELGQWVDRGSDEDIPTPNTDALEKLRERRANRGSS